MRWKTTLALLCIVAGVGAYISLYELRQPDPEERRRLASEVLRVPDNATQIRIAFAGQPPVLLSRTGAAWRLKPGDFRTDPMYVQGLLGALNLHASRTITPAPSASLAEFGLTPPAGTVTVTASGHDTALLLGRATPVPGSRYVKRADRPEVFIVDAQAVEAAEHPAEQFRDHALLRLEPWQVLSARWTDGTRTLWVAREGGAWHLQEPVSAEADGEAVERWLTQWGSLPIARFVNDAAQPADQAAAGVEGTAQRFEVSVQGGRTITASIGTALAEDAALRHALRSDEPSAIYAIAAADVAALNKSPEDLRKKEASATKAAPAADGSPEAPQRRGTP